MSDNLRVVQVGGRTIELCYGSDLYWLWAWHDQIWAYLYDAYERDGYDEPPPKPGEWLGFFVFYPTEETAKALQRFSVDYRYIVERLQTFHDTADQKLTAFVANENDNTKDDLFTAMEELDNEIESAVLVIAEAEQPKEAGSSVPQQKKPKATVNARMFDEIGKDPQKAGWTAKQWACYLRCAESTVVATTIWKSLRMEKLETSATKKKDRQAYIRKQEEEGLI